MKGFLICCSILISLGMFLPFIQDYSVFELQKLTHHYVDTSKVVLFIIMFVISSWFISIGYSKKLKISILGIIGTLFYLYMYFNIFDFILSYDDYASYLFKNETGFNFVLALLGDFGKNIGIGFYILLLGFLGNSLGIFSIIYKTYQSLNILGKNINNFFILKANPNAVIRDDGMRVYEKNEVIDEVKNIPTVKQETIKNEMLNVVKISKLKLTLFFVLGNIINIGVTGGILIVLLDYLYYTSPIFKTGQIQLFFLGLLITIVIGNLYLINRYVKRFIEEKILFKYFIGIGIAFLLVLFYMIKFNY